MTSDSAMWSDWRFDRLEPCADCHGQRIIDASGGTAACAACDGSGVQETAAYQAWLLDTAVSERLRGL